MTMTDLYETFRDDVARTLHKVTCPYPGCTHRGGWLDEEKADAVVAMLRAKYDLDAHIDALAVEWYDQSIPPGVDTYLTVRSTHE
jgi:hypothetical protein